VPKVTDKYLETRRRQIMEAAITCFSRSGFHRTTVQDIISEAGVSAGLVYRYFRSKEDIVSAIAQQHHADEAAALDQASQGSLDAPRALKALALASLGRLADTEEQRWRRVTVQLWAEALRDSQILDIVRSGLDEPVALVAAILRRGQREGSIRPTLDAVGAAHVCASIFQGLVLQQAWNPDLDVERYISAVLDITEALRPG
jgi:AcrR family transcriptional regulator